MSEIRKLLTKPGLTNAQACLTNWMMLALVVVEWTLAFFIADERTATRLVGVTAAIYSGGLLLGPFLAKRLRPETTIERGRAWLTGVAGFGGVGLFLQLRTTMLVLFD